MKPTTKNGRDDPAASICVRQSPEPMTTAATHDTILDLRGLRCPHPVLRAKKALKQLPIGSVLILECTDPLTVLDVPHFVNQTGHALQAQEQRGSLYVFRIVKQK